MEKAVDLGAAWREIVSKKIHALGYDAIDITALDKAYTKAHGHVYMEQGEENALQNKSNIRRQFVYTDLNLIENDADAVIAYYDEAFRQGSGSFSECQAAYDNEKPLFIVSAFSKIPTWLQSIATKVFYDFDDLYFYLAGLPEGILNHDVYLNHRSGNYYLCSLCGYVFEKSNHHFVSKISPLYCKPCVDIVEKTREKHFDRYQFIVEQLEANRK